MGLKRDLYTPGCGVSAKRYQHFTFVFQLCSPRLFPEQTGSSIIHWNSVIPHSPPAPQGSACATWAAMCTCITSLPWWTADASSQAPSTGRWRRCSATLRTSWSPKSLVWSNPSSESSVGYGQTMIPLRMDLFRDQNVAQNSLVLCDTRGGGALWVSFKFWKTYVECLFRVLK